MDFSNPKDIDAVATIPLCTASEEKYSKDLLIKYKMRFRRFIKSFDLFGHPINLRFNGKMGKERVTRLS